MATHCQDRKYAQFYTMHSGNRGGQSTEHGPWFGLIRIKGVITATQVATEKATLGPDRVQFSLLCKRLVAGRL